MFVIARKYKISTLTLSEGKLVYDITKLKDSFLYWSQHGWVNSGYYVYPSLEEAKKEIVDILKKDSNHEDIKIIPPPKH